ncbi:hypothetical protein ACFL4L_05650 [bacterium]
MKTMTKTILILIMTFLLGIITGAVVQGFFMRQSMHKFTMRMKTPEGFIHRFEEIIQPTDEQRKEIRKILQKHHKEMMRFQREFPSRMDSLRKDLEMILTQEQKEELKNVRWMRKERGHRGDRHDRRSSFMHRPDSLAPPPPPPMPLDTE